MHSRNVPCGWSPTLLTLGLLQVCPSLGKNPENGRESPAKEVTSPCRRQYGHLHRALPGRRNTSPWCRRCLHRLIDESRSHSEISIAFPPRPVSAAKFRAGAVWWAAQCFTCSLADACANETTTPPISKTAPVQVTDAALSHKPSGNAHYWLALRVTNPANLPSTSPAGSFDPIKLIRSFWLSFASRTEFPSTVAKVTLDVTL